ncbi:MAG: hypothetical protein AAF705_13510 [Bacteroidota bacterium]
MSTEACVNKAILDDNLSWGKSLLNKKVKGMNKEVILDNLSWIDKIAGFVWVILSALLIYLLYTIFQRNGANNRYFITGCSLLIFIWLYPFYTSFFSNLIIGEVGNLLTLLYTVVFIYIIRGDFNPQYKLMYPQIAWLVVATFYVGLQLSVKG